MSCDIQLVLLISGVILTSAILSIIMPVLVPYYESIYFILVMTSLQFCIIFGILLLIVSKCKLSKPKNIKILAWSGFTNAMMAIFMIYSVDPSRTPIVIQCILSGAVILPSVIFTKHILNKKVIYDMYYIGPSIVCLIISIILSFVPLSSEWSPMAVVWIFIFAIGIVFRSLFSILQEKYIVDTKDYTFINKISLVFYSRVFQFLTMLLFYWLEYVMGYKKNSPQDEFVESITTFGTNISAFMLLEGFVLAYFASFIINVYLNVISTNYNMISSSAGNALTAVFFTIFSSLNNGFSFPLQYMIPCVLFSVMSIIFWIKGETKISYVNLNSDQQNRLLSPTEGENLLIENNKKNNTILSDADDASSV